jgi:hypothetical protein
LQNIPTGVDSEVQQWVKKCFVAPSGSLFWARDFSAIEARLVGYFAGSPEFIRLASLGVHAYLASHIAHKPVSLSWSDSDLKEAFAELKAHEPVLYATAKRVVYLSLYMGTPRKMHFEYPIEFPTIAEADRLQGLFFELCPAVREWHRTLCLTVDGTKQRKRVDGSLEKVDPWTLGVCYARNPFGYVHRFYNVLDWEKPADEWVWSFGEDAKRLASFFPQSTAAGIIKRAAKRLWYDYPTVGQTLRLLIHDEALGEATESLVEECLAVSKMVMEEPIPELPLDPTWNLGEFLTIGTEAKVGPSWGDMQKVNE